MWRMIDYLNNELGPTISSSMAARLRRQLSPALVEQLSVAIGDPLSDHLVTVLDSEIEQALGSSRDEYAPMFR